MAPTISSTATLTHSENWSGFDSSSVVDFSTRISEHTGSTTDNSNYSQDVLPSEQEVESRAAEQV